MSAAAVQRWLVIEFARRCHRMLAVKAFLAAHPYDPVPEWLAVLTRIWKASDGSRVRAAAERAEDTLVYLLKHPERQDEFDAVARLGNRPAVTAWMKDALRPKLSPEEAKQVRLAGIAKKVQRAERTARARLAIHEAALKKEQRAVKQWRKRVAYFDRRRERGELA